MDDPEKTSDEQAEWEAKRRALGIDHIPRHLVSKERTEEQRKSDEAAERVWAMIDRINAQPGGFRAHFKKLAVEQGPLRRLTEFEDEEEA